MNLDDDLRKVLVDHDIPLTDRVNDLLIELAETAHEERHYAIEEAGMVGDLDDD
jgi:hypothetical protein